MGANGSRRSTLLKLLDGRLFTREGTIEALGHVLGEEIMANQEFCFAVRRWVGFVSQDPDATVSGDFIEVFFCGFRPSRTPIYEPRHGEGFSLVC
jgi:ABC-type molybdenum transport system ATPase subunit/photorepair protein PhrA